jgi:hypothetical protein
MVGWWLPWQRIAFGFLLVALCEIWAPRGPCHNIPEGTLGICKVYFVHWLDLCPSWSVFAVQLWPCLMTLLETFLLWIMTSIDTTKWREISATMCSIRHLVFLFIGTIGPGAHGRGAWLVRVVTAGIFITYLALLYGIYVPDWEFLPPSLSSNSTLIQASSALTVSVVGKYLLIKTCTCQGSLAGSTWSSLVVPNFTFSWVQNCKTLSFWSRSWMTTQFHSKCLGFSHIESICTSWILLIAQIGVRTLWQ